MLSSELANVFTLVLVCFSLLPSINGMNPPHISSLTTFSKVGDSIFRKAHGLSRIVGQSRFSVLFWVTPTMCRQAWHLIYTKLPPSSKPERFMWAIMFLKINAFEYVNYFLTRADEKRWLIFEYLYNLDVVSFDSTV